MSVWLVVLIAVTLYAVFLLPLKHYNSSLLWVFFFFSKLLRLELTFDL